MEEKIKQRILGGLVLAGLVAIILSFLFHNSRPTTDTTIADNTTSQQNSSVTLPAQSTAVAVSTNTQAVQTPTVAVATSPNTQTVQTPTVAVASSPATVSVVTPSSAEPSEQPGVTAANQDSAQGSAQDSAQDSASALQAAAENAALSANNATANNSTPTQSQPIAQTNNPVVTSSPAQPAAVQPAKIPTVAAKKPSVVSHHKTHSTLARGAWVIQLGAFSDSSNAKKLVTTLRDKHFHAYLKHEHRDGKILSVVFVGPEISEQKSVRIRNELKRSLNLSGVVRKYES